MPVIAATSMPSAPPRVPPSTVHLPPGAWATVLDALCARFATIPREVWLDRMARGQVTDAVGRALTPEQRYSPGMCVRYVREVQNEVAIPFHERVVHHDADLLVVDKPHFLPVMPAGAYAQHTLLTRLMARIDQPALVPLHRIDRLTAGLVMLSCNPTTRARYQSLFREQEPCVRWLCFQMS